MNEGLARIIPGRELIELPGHGVTVRGTLHTGAKIRTEGCFGIAFLNSLSLPRTASGDCAVYWADHFAHAGYPSFRLDLPGLGDSGGDTPVELLNYINAGEYGAIAAAKLKELVNRFGLSGMVLVGHCAGTVTAIYAAARCSDECKGLILLDPYFHLPQAVRPRVRRGLSEWAMQNRFGGLLSSLYDRLKELRLALRGSGLPRNANKRLLHCWKKLASAGMPVLFFKAPMRKALGTQPRVGEFDYLSYVLQVAGPASDVEVKLVEDTDHSFANYAGRAVVARETEQWLWKHMPVGLKDDMFVLFPDAGAKLSNSDKQTSVDCLQR